MANQLKAVHDRLLAAKPDGATHEAMQCPFCAMEAEGPDPRKGGQVADFTQEQVDAMLAKAIKDATEPLQSRITELEAAKLTDDVEVAVAAATSAFDAEKVDLQAQLDAAHVAKTAAETQLAELTTYLEAEAVAAAEAAHIAEVKDQRIEEAKAAKVLDEQYIEANADRFAAMTDEDWSFRLDEWKLAAGAVGAATAPVATAFQASRQPDSGAKGSALHLIGDMRRLGENPTKIA